MTKDTSEPQLIGNRYQILDKLGEGGMGAVYQGQDTQTNELVAIKLLKAEAIASDPDILERFAREGEALRQLNHPNIVKMLATVEEGDKHYLIMEYMPGGDLSDTLKETPQLPIHQILALSIELSDALTRAHYLKIIHRDLKPANILIATDGTPRLTDFGVAHMVEMERVTGTGITIGTWDYLAPEIIGGGVPDTRTDIWAAGVMLFEMIAGRRPFIGNFLTQVIMSIVNDPVPDLEALRPDCPIGLVDLTYRMLERDPNARMSSVRLIGAELEALIQGTDIDTSSIGEIRELVNMSENRFVTPAPTASIIKNNLPNQTTPFVGREAELQELVQLIDTAQTQLVTVVGQGGMGKTRLALEVAQRIIVGTHSTLSSHNVSFSNGAYFISLAPISSVDDIVPTIADATGYQFEQGGRDTKQQLLDYLQEKKMLLIVDNFEHLIGGVNLINEILQTAPNIQVITTSREKLNLSGETIFNLGGMTVPDLEASQATNYSQDISENSAVKLFIQGAQRIQPNFELEGDDLSHVVHVCRLVQGMPLGILLAAAWVEMLTPKEIADEVTQSLDFLETEMHDIPERHRSIRAVFDYSWNLIEETERETFMKLAVFRGGFTREAAQKVAGAGLRTLQRLVNKSLLRRDTDSGRYEGQELLLHYAEGLLEESGTADHTRDTHSTYYLKTVGACEDGLKGLKQLVMLNKIKVDFENVRTAWSWATQQRDYDAIDDALEALYWFCEMHDRFQEGLVFFQTAQEKMSDAPPDEKSYFVWSRVLARYTLFFFKNSPQQHDRAQELLNKSLTIAREYGNEAEIAFCLRALGGVVMDSADYSDALPVFEESLTYYRNLDDRFYMARTLDNIAYYYSLAGQSENNSKFARQALELQREINDKQGAAGSLNNLGAATFRRGNYEEAENFLREAIAIGQEMGDRRRVGWSGHVVSVVTYTRGALEESKSIAEDSLQIAIDLNDSNSQAFSYAFLGLVASVRENYSQGKTLSATAHSLVTGHPFIPLFVNWGQSMAACGLGDYPAAHQFMQVVLENAVSKHVEPVVIACLPLSSVILAHTGEQERAVELLALVSTFPKGMTGWMKEWSLLTRLQDDLQSKLVADTYSAAWERGKLLDLEMVVKELLKE